MSGEDERRKEIPGKCPTPTELGVSGWNILHSSAAVYPYKPSEVQQKAMKSFIESWAHVYACSWCAYHMRDYVRQHPPEVTDKVAVSRYVCELHNEVSERLGKDLFDCSPDVVLRRWHPGYPNKMEDKPTIEEQLALAAKQKAEAAAAKRQQQETEEHRFSDFGLQTREGTPRDPAGWRDPLATANKNEKKKSNNSGGEGKRWWFFGSSAFGSAAPSPHADAPQPEHNSINSNGQSTTTAGADHGPASALSPPPAASRTVAAGWNTKHRTGSVGASSAALPQTPRQAKAADGETDVDAVLDRLKRCQVYCPEDEELQKH